MLKRGRKAGVDPVLTAIMGTLLAALVLFTAFYIANKGAGLIKRSQSPEEQASLNSFVRLHNKFNSLLAVDRNFVSVNEDLFMDPGFTMVGFDKGADKLDLPIIGYIYNSERTMFKPNRCDKKACLCIYHSADIKISQIQEQGLVDCRSLDSDVTFITKFDGKQNLVKRSDQPDISPKGVEYAHLFWFSEVKGKYYLEKLVKGKNVYLYATLLDHDAISRKDVLVYDKKASSLIDNIKKGNDVLEAYHSLLTNYPKEVLDSKTKEEVILAYYPFMSQQSLPGLDSKFKKPGEDLARQIISDNSYSPKIHEKAQFIIAVLTHDSNEFKKYLQSFPEGENKKDVLWELVYGFNLPPDEKQKYLQDLQNLSPEDFEELTRRQLVG